jgi:hypothetical protein
MKNEEWTIDKRRGPRRNGGFYKWNADVTDFQSRIYSDLLYTYFIFFVCGPLSVVRLPRFLVNRK